MKKLLSLYFFRDPLCDCGLTFKDLIFVWINKWLIQTFPTSFSHYIQTHFISNCFHSLILSVLCISENYIFSLHLGSIGRDKVKFFDKATNEINARVSASVLRVRFMREMEVGRIVCWGSARTSKWFDSHWCTLPSLGL